MPIITSIVSWFNIKRLSQIELMRKYPFNTQQDTFSKLIDSARDTEWGIKYDYKSIKKVKDFQSRVPIQDYDDIKPYVDRLRKGEKNLLWHSDIKWFAKSSGTTNDKSKFIPVSKEALEACHFQAGKDGIALYVDRYPDTNVFSGKTLALGGANSINNFSQKSYYGDLSAVLIQNLPFWAEFIRTPSLQTALMDKWDEKIEKMTEEERQYLLDQWKQRKEEARKVEREQKEDRIYHYLVDVGHIILGKLPWRTHRASD